MLSVVVPMRNASAFVDQALKSALAEPEVSEVIAVDDGSSDDSFERAASWPRVLVLRQHHKGPGAARNLGARRATQPFLAFLDADDVWLAGKSALQLEALRARERAYSICAFESFIEPGTVGHDPRAPGWERARRAALPSGLVVARSLFEEIGGFDERLATVEDVEWFSRADRAELGRALVDRVLFRKRWHTQNTSLTTPGNTERLFGALRHRLGDRQ